MQAQTAREVKRKKSKNKQHEIARDYCTQTTFYILHDNTARRGRKGTNRQAYIVKNAKQTNAESSLKSQLP